MNADELILEGSYTGGKPFVRAKIVIVNQETSRQTTIIKHFKIDTGFDGGIHVSQSHMNDLTMIGVKPIIGTIGLAGGVPGSAYRCLAYLQQIGDHELPMPGIEAELIFHGGSRYGLIGLEILKYWIAQFDGPNELLTIRSAPQISEIAGKEKV